ncbi:MAG: nucleotidyltransferase domain-containing protein [Isosphaeraceae bacterium]
MAPDPAILDEMVRRMVETVHPLRIVLFGSAARGEMGPHSDLEALVVMPDGCDCRATAKTLIGRLRGLGCPTDLVVVRQVDVDHHRDNPYYVIHTALSEGKELYHAAS